MSTRYTDWAAVPSIDAGVTARTGDVPFDSDPTADKHPATRLVSCFTLASSVLPVQPRTDSDGVDVELLGPHEQCTFQGQRECRPRKVNGFIQCVPRPHQTTSSIPLTRAPMSHHPRPCPHSPRRRHRRELLSSQPASGRQCHSCVATAAVVAATPASQLPPPSPFLPPRGITSILRAQRAHRDTSRAVSVSVSCAAHCAASRLRGQRVESQRAVWLGALGMC